MVIIADSRGHGRSSLTNEPFSYELMASDYVALLNFLKIRKVAIVGWSDGANIGFAMAMSHPELITGLFAHAPNVTTDGLLAGGSRTSAFQSYQRKCASEYQRMSKTPGDYNKLAEKLSLMWKSQPKWTTSQLAKITVPVWVVLGDHDEVIKSEHVNYISSVIPNSKLLIMKETGHFSMVQDPTGYMDAIWAFLQNCHQDSEQQKELSLQKESKPEEKKQAPVQEKQDEKKDPNAHYLPYLENAEVNQQKLKGFLIASGYGRNEGKAFFFTHCGFKAEEIEKFTQALLEHARQNKVSRTEETAHGTRYEVEGRLPCVDAHERTIRVVWFIDSGISVPRLLNATPLKDLEK